MPEDEFEADSQRWQRILWDLLGRVGERVFLCHSDLGVNGTEQTGHSVATMTRTLNPQVSISLVSFCSLRLK